jgi:carboxymethylenebutenolidase
MKHDIAQIRTQDGICPVHTFAPEGDGPWPSVLMFMDAHGVRPALYELAERLANHGYVVALPDLYYRSGFVAPPGAKLFSDPTTRAYWTEQVLPTLSAENIARDMPAFIAYLDSRSDVRDGSIGVVGYCLGGRLALVAAGRFPERVAAVASYHGAGLATDAPESPHRLAPNMAARVYVGGAKEDATFDDAQKVRLEAALTGAGVDHLIETYDAKHGWVPSDTATHDPAAAERHWVTLFALFDQTLEKR